MLLSTQVPGYLYNYGYVTAGGTVYGQPVNTLISGKWFEHDASMTKAVCLHRIHVHTHKSHSYAPVHILAYALED